MDDYDDAIHDMLDCYARADLEGFAKEDQKLRNMGYDAENHQLAVMSGRAWVMEMRQAVRFATPLFERYRNTPLRDTEARMTLACRFLVIATRQPTTLAYVWLKIQTYIHGVPSPEFLRQLMMEVKYRAEQLPYERSEASFRAITGGDHGEDDSTSSE